MNGAQPVRFEKGTTEFKNYFKQIPVQVPNNSLWRFILKKYQAHIRCSFAYKLVCADDKLSKPTVVFRGENAAFKFIEAILREYEYCKKVMKKLFNKNLNMTDEEEEQFQLRNTC